MKTSQEFNDFIGAWENAELQITDKISYKIRDVINKNDELFHGKFENPTDGTFTKIFYNIGFVIFRTVFQVIVKTIGTKDIQMHSLNGKGIQAVALLRLAIQSYLKRIKFGTFLNDLCYFLKDGTTYVKIVDGLPVICNNHNIVRPPYGGTVQETGIGEKVLYSWQDMQSHKKEWKDSWTEIEKLKLLMDKKQVKDFIVYEYWNEHAFNDKNECPTESELKEGKYKTHKGCIKYLDIQFTEPNDRTRTQEPSEWQPYLELERFITPHKKKRTSKRMRDKLGEYEELYPYKELHFIKVPGRTLAFSIFELISGIIEAYNRKMNLHDKKDILDLMGVFKHKKNNNSPSIAQQLLNNIQNGTVVEMEIDEDLERLIIDTKTGELLASTDKLFELARQIIGVSMSGTGIDMPATTTATTAVLNKQTQQTTFEYAIEQVSIFLTELFDDFFLETILDELSAEDLIMVSGDKVEIQELDKFFTEQMALRNSERRYKEIETAKGDVSWADVNMLEGIQEAEIQGNLDELKKFGDKRWAELKKEVLKHLNYSFEFYVNNESFDKNTKIQNLLAMRQNTELSSKKIDMTLMDLMGENPKAFEKTPEEIKAEMDMLQQKTAIENTGLGVPSPMTPGKEFATNNPMV